jgi:flavin-dependent dehydrogenase
MSFPKRYLVRFGPKQTAHLFTDFLVIGGGIAGMRAALAVSSTDPEVVLIEARKAAERAVAPVVPIGALSRYDRPKPTLNGYDTLLEASS